MVTMSAARLAELIQGSIVKGEPDAVFSGPDSTTEYWPRSSESRG